MTDKSMNNSLEGIITNEKVVVISEVQYDSYLFNETAYENLLQSLQNDSDVTGIIVDGAISRVDRPQYLNEELTFWEKSEEECRDFTNEVTNAERYNWMFDKQLEILESRLGELKKRMPDAKIVFASGTDDLQYSISAMQNVALLGKGNTINQKIGDLKSKKKGFEDKLKQYSKERQDLEFVDGSGAQRGGLSNRIRSLEGKVRNTTGAIENAYDDREFHRPRTDSPSHQHFSKVFVTEMLDKIQAVCDRVGVEHIGPSGILKFGDLTIDYAHNRHNTPNPIKGQAKRVTEMVYNSINHFLGENIDVVLESGHHGQAHTHVVKRSYTDSQLNFEGTRLYSPDHDDSAVLVVLAPSFEDQHSILNFIQGKETVRMGGGKPTSTRKHAVIDRFTKGGRTGIFAVCKDSEGLVYTEGVQFQDYKDGTILETLRDNSSYSSIVVTSDDHIGSDGCDYMLLDGVKVYFKEGLVRPSTFRGKPTLVKGYINGGDTAEANSDNWTHRYQTKFNPTGAFDETIERLAQIDLNDPSQKKDLALWVANIAKAGHFENMEDILDMTADFLMSFYEAGYNESNLKHLLVQVTGNHADGVLKKLGLREHNFITQRLKGMKHGFYQVGRGVVGHNPRAFFGGYSSARNINIPDYGVNTDGSVAFGPINLVVQHDPKGGNTRGIVGAARAAGADVSIAGHTHEHYVETFNKGLNQWGIAIRAPTTQNITATEVYYAAGLVRYEGALEVILPKPGQFMSKVLPVGYLKQKGHDFWLNKASQ